MYSSFVYYISYGTSLLQWYTPIIQKHKDDAFEASLSYTLKVPNTMLFILNLNMFWGLSINRILHFL